MHRRRVASPSQTAPDTNIVHTLLRSLVSSEPPVSQGDPSGSADWWSPSSSPACATPPQPRGFPEASGPRSGACSLSVLALCSGHGGQPGRAGEPDRGSADAGFRISPEAAQLDRDGRTGTTPGDPSWTLRLALAAPPNGSDSDPAAGAAGGGGGWSCKPKYGKLMILTSKWAGIGLSCLSLQGRTHRKYPMV
jgi:hypothetical protein